jgi:hypothetical protein
MFVIGEAVIDDEVGTELFCCDVKKCKGACCTLPGGRGAPLEDDEIPKLRKAYPTARQYLSQRNIDFIETHGMVDGFAGSFATTCIDNRDCVFVYYEADVARCALERAYEDGKTGWRKPISCHLFPIRVRSFGHDSLRYEQVAECEAGRRRGEAEQVRLHDFLKAPLTRKYGEEWYKNFLEHCRTQLK